MDERLVYGEIYEVSTPVLTFKGVYVGKQRIIERNSHIIATIKNEEDERRNRLAVYRFGGNFTLKDGKIKPKYLRTCENLREVDEEYLLNLLKKKGLTS